MGDNMVGVDRVGDERNSRGGEGVMGDEIGGEDSFGQSHNPPDSTDEAETTAIYHQINGEFSETPINVAAGEASRGTDDPNDTYVEERDRLIEKRNKWRENTNKIGETGGDEREVMDPTPYTLEMVIEDDQELQELTIVDEMLISIYGETLNMNYVTPLDCAI